MQQMLEIGEARQEATEELEEVGEMIKEATELLDEKHMVNVVEEHVVQMANAVEEHDVQMVNAVEEHAIQMVNAIENQGEQIVSIDDNVQSSSSDNSPDKVDTSVVTEPQPDPAHLQDQKAEAVVCYGES